MAVVSWRQSGSRLTSIKPGRENSCWIFEKRRKGSNSSDLTGLASSSYPSLKWEHSEKIGQCLQKYSRIFSNNESSFFFGLSKIRNCIFQSFSKMKHFGKTRLSFLLGIACHFQSAKCLGALTQTGSCSIDSLPFCVSTENIMLIGYNFSNRKRCCYPTWHWWAFAWWLNFGAQYSMKLKMGKKTWAWGLTESIKCFSPSTASGHQRSSFTKKLSTYKAHPRLDSFFGETSTGQKIGLSRGGKPRSFCKLSFPFSLAFLLSAHPASLAFTRFVIQVELC